MNKIDLKEALNRMKFYSFSTDELNDLFRKENNELRVLCETLKKNMQHEVSCYLPWRLTEISYTDVEVDIDGCPNISQIAYDIEFDKTKGNSYVTVIVTLSVSARNHYESVQILIKEMPQDGIYPHIVLDPGTVISK